MTLHVFNPSHDEALAADYPYYYPSNIARRLQTEWGLLPMIWAAPGDAVLTDDATQPLPAAGRFGHVRQVTARQLTPAFWQNVKRIVPWGWDLLLRHRLRKLGAPEDLLPTDAQLAAIRRLSSRETTAAVLPVLRTHLENAGLRTTGESCIVSTWDEALCAFARWPSVFVKGLWSCSGRGVFKVTGTPTASDSGRLQRLLERQGGVEVQRACKALTDFALEFDTDGAGHVRYLGISSFVTNASGGYGGNVVAPQPVIEKSVSAQFEHAEWLQPLVEACTSTFGPQFSGEYAGPFGVDMMVADTPAGPAIFPCVEVNLRRTMGHVAIDMAKHSLNAGDMPPQLQNLWYFYA